MRPRYRDLFCRMCDPDPIERETAFDAVLFDRHEALPDIIAAYRAKRFGPTKKAEFRFDLVQLMGFSGSTDALAPLLEALSDRDPDVQAEACRSLEDLKPVMDVAFRQQICERLRSMLTHRAAVVRHAAGDALVALEGPATRRKVVGD